jgi:hypothetical protein
MVYEPVSIITKHFQTNICPDVYSDEHIIAQQLCWLLSIYWIVFNKHNVLGVDSIAVSKWLSKKCSEKF